MRPEKFWDKVAVKSDIKFLTPDQIHVNTINGVVKHLNNSDVILDFACGIGTKTIDIAGNFHSIRAIDTSSKMIEIANKRATMENVSNVEFEEIDIFNNQLKTQSFDVILALNILHLIEEPELIIERIRALLKPEGLFISATACLGERWTPLTSCLLLLGKTKLIPNFNKFSTSSLEGIIRDQGFEIVETDNISKALSERLIVARKIN